MSWLVLVLIVFVILLNLVFVFYNRYKDRRDIIRQYDELYNVNYDNKKDSN